MCCYELWSARCCLTEVQMYPVGDGGDGCLEKLEGHVSPLATLRVDFTRFAEHLQPQYPVPFLRTQRSYEGKWKFKSENQYVAKFESGLEFDFILSNQDVRIHQKRPHWRASCPNASFLVPDLFGGVCPDFYHTGEIRMGVVYEFVSVLGSGRKITAARTWNLEPRGGRLMSEVIG